MAIKLETRDGKVLANSRDVAEAFEKEHKHVLRDIEALISKIGGSNFGPSSYVSVQGKTLPCYEMDRDGFTLLAMSFTGEKALKFKLAYIAVNAPPYPSLKATRTP